jgi:hypothetical protein
MKKQLILATALALSAISCHKTHSDSPEIKQYFRGKVNGVFFSDSTTAGISICCSCPRCPPPIPTVAGRCTVGLIALDFGGSWPDTGELNLAYPFGYKITLTLDNGQPFFAGYNRITASGIEEWQGSGKITILETSGPYMKGSFECVAPADSAVGIFPPISITEGEFNLKIPQ